MNRPPLRQTPSLTPVDAPSTGTQRPSRDLGPASMFARAWRWCHWFSLDIGLGAALSALWVGRAWGSEPSKWSIIALACGALWVYSVDHWADAGKARHLMAYQISARREFYVHQRFWLALIATASAIVGGWASLWLPASTQIFGVICLIVCGGYLWGVQRRPELARVRYPKELLITSLYSAALSLWPISHVFDPPASFSPIEGSISSALIFCLAWANLCLISAHERRDDAAEGSSSLALRLGEFTTRNMGRGMLRCGVFLWGVRFVPVSVTGPYSWVRLADASASALMLFTLWQLYRRPEWSALHSRYRLWADLVFVYPALGLIIDWI